MSLGNLKDTLNYYYYIHIVLVVLLDVKNLSVSLCRCATHTEEIFLDLAGDFLGKNLATFFAAQPLATVAPLN